MSECKHKWEMGLEGVTFCAKCYLSPAEAECKELKADVAHLKGIISTHDSAVAHQNKVIRSLRGAAQEFYDSYTLDGHVDTDKIKSALDNTNES